MNTNDKLRELIRSPLSTAVEVTQVDREAAWTYANFGHLPDRQERERWFSGYYDNSPVGRPIQAFARHRQASIAQQAEEVARLRSFIKSIDDDWINNEAASEDEWSDGYEDCLGEYAKKARAALSEQPGGEG